MVTNIDELKSLKNLNSIYLNEDFNREKIDFLLKNFKNGDRYTKQYILDKKYDLGADF